MSQQMSGLAGQSPVTTEGPRPDPGMMGPMPGETTPGSGLMGVLSGFKKLTDFAGFLGDTPEEREKNAKQFAALVKDVGGAVNDMGDSTLMQRMMKASMSGPQYLNDGSSPSGGVAAIPRTFDPSLASHIVNQMGYK